MSQGKARGKATGKKQTANRGANGTKGSSWIKPYLRLALYMRDDFTCTYCLTSLKDMPSHVYALDHIKPMNHYDDNACDPSNIILSCTYCNSSKKDKSFQDFIATSPRVKPGIADRVLSNILSPLNIELAKELVNQKIRSKRKARKQVN